MKWSTNYIIEFCYREEDVALAALATIMNKYNVYVRAGHGSFNTSCVTFKMASYLAILS